MAIACMHVLLLHSVVMVIYLVNNHFFPFPLANCELPTQMVSYHFKCTRLQYNPKTPGIAEQNARQTVDKYEEPCP